MLVICTAVHLKNPTQGLNRMLKSKNMDSFQSLLERGMNMAISFLMLNFLRKHCITLLKYFRVLIFRYL
ncbi:hypothetical protein DSECCO2_158670 [anaerobic digester metagenome]